MSDYIPDRSLSRAFTAHNKIPITQNYSLKECKFVIQYHAGMSDEVFSRMFEERTPTEILLWTEATLNCHGYPPKPTKRQKKTPPSVV